MAEAQPGVGGGLARELEAQARQRFVSWDRELWAELCAGPARRLEDGLVAARLPANVAEPVLTSYLRLACEGVGLGYLYHPSSAGASFFTMAWSELIPEALPALRPERMADVLAECWNLGENLESAPVWLRHIFMRVLASGGPPDLGDLRTFVEDVSEKALGEPARRLGARARRHWVHLATDDPRFLPGRLQFLAPTVVAIHARDGTAERDGVATVGVWLTDPPLFLGSMGRMTPPEKSADARWDLVEQLAKADPGAAEVREMATNPWRAAVTLELSQFLVALHPE